MTAPTPTLQPFVRQWAVLLTTYRRDGTPVGTPVNIAVDGDLAFVRTWDAAWKLKRIRNNPEVEVAPCTVRGKPTGPAIRARAIREGAQTCPDQTYGKIRWEEFLREEVQRQRIGEPGGR